MRRRQAMRAMAGMAAAGVLAAMPRAVGAQDAAPTRGVRVDAARPDANDSQDSVNAYALRKEVMDGRPTQGEFALTANSLNLREGPGYTSRILTVMPGNGTVSVEGEARENFYPVNFQSQLGWADMSLLRRLAPETPAVIGVGTLLETTPLYDAPDAGARQVTTWVRGNPVSYFAEVDGGEYKGSKRWLRVMTNPDYYVSTASVSTTATVGLQMPAPLLMGGPLGWLGLVGSAVNVRTGPGAQFAVLKTWPVGRRVLVYAEVEGEAYGGSTKWYQVAAPPEQSAFLHSSFVKKQADVLPVENPPYTGRWIDINLTQQVVVAYMSAQPLLVVQAATGTTKNPTEEGTHASWLRLASQRMKGDDRFSDDYYNLDAVPYIQYFHSSGEAIHGCYWHDAYGTQRSHGCVNTSIVASQWLLQWAPLGTKVVVHQ